MGFFFEKPTDEKCENADSVCRGLTATSLYMVVIFSRKNR